MQNTHKCKNFEGKQGFKILVWWITFYGILVMLHSHQEGKGIIVFIFSSTKTLTLLELTRTPTNWLLWNSCPALVEWLTYGRRTGHSYITELAQHLQLKDSKKRKKKKRKGKTNSSIPHSLHSALIRSQTARENKSTKHVSCPTLNNLECKNETATMSSWVCFFFFFHYIICFYIKTDFIGPDCNLLTWLKFFVGRRWEVFFKKKVFKARTEKLHHFLKQSLPQSLHCLIKSQYCIH